MRIKLLKDIIDYPYGIKYVYKKGEIIAPLSGHLNYINYGCDEESKIFAIAIHGHGVYTYVSKPNFEIIKNE